MQLHYFDDLADFRGESAAWLGLILQVRQAGTPRLRVNSARNWHLRVDLNEHALLWANMPELDYQTLRIYRQIPEQAELLPAFPARIVNRLIELDPQARRKAYLHWFVQSLQKQPNLCLRDGNWVLHYVAEGNGPVHYLTRRCRADWQAALSAREREFGAAMLLELDWGLVGNGSILPLKAAVPAAHGRLKYWRKQAKSGMLPPILLWRVAALDVWLILDGHIRLQACLEEGIAPDYVLLDSYIEQHYPVDLHAAQQIEKQIEAQALRMQRGQIKSDSLMKIQGHLVTAYDDRAQRRFISHARAGLTVDEWQQQVQHFLQQHPDATWFWLD